MKIKKKNRIILSICCAFIALVSVFSFIPFKSNKQVKADTVDFNYQFKGSDLYYLDCYIVDNGNASPVVNTVCFSISFSNSLNNLINVDIDFSAVAHSTDYLGVSYTDCIVGYFDYDSGNTSFSDIVLSSSNGHFLKAIPDFQIELGNYGYYYTILCQVKGNFNCNVQYVNLYLTDYTQSVFPRFTYFNDLNSKLVNIEYFDNNGNSILFQSFVPNGYRFDTRTYYFSNALDNLDGYTEGFKNGQNVGFSEGQSKGYSDGYGVGYIDGENDGYWVGYEEALVGTNKYSFNGLLTAVIDVPVKTFTSLFNFEILGVNLSGFFLGLLTISIIITIVRFMLGG